MASISIIIRAANALAALLPDAKSDPAVLQIFESEQLVRTAFASVFALDQIHSITEDHFRAFLPFNGNHHWTGLTRVGYRACDDMTNLRNGLAMLVDEARPLMDRYDQALKTIPGMGKALATAILMVAHDNRYGVWNGVQRSCSSAIECISNAQRFRRHTLYCHQ